MRCHCFDNYAGSIGYGHSVEDERGFFYSCTEPERYAKKNAHEAVEREFKERAELKRLKEKYES